MPHILFVTPYYPPEITPPAMRIHELARGLLRLGYQVTVLTTFPNFPAGIIPKEYRGHIRLQEHRDGIHIVRVWSYIHPNRGFLRRILSQLSFGCVAPFLAGNALGHPDVIVVESPPLFNAIAGRTLAWWKSCPFIFTVADLWPEVAVQMGMLRNRLLIRLATWLEWSTYQRAARVWVVTAGLRDILVQRGLPLEKIIVVTNGVDCGKFYPLSQNLARTALGWDQRFTVLYAGSHGPSHGLGAVLDAATLLRAETHIHLILVGDGAEKAALMDEAQRRALSNLTFLDPQPYKRIPLLLAASDACLATASKAILFQGVLPVKMYEAMACARPIILAVDGEACRIAIQQAGAAIYAEPENPDAIAQTIIYLSQHPLEAQALGQRGRAFVQLHFDRQQLTKNLHQHLLTLLRQSSTCLAGDLHLQPSTERSTMLALPAPQREGRHVQAAKLSYRYTCWKHSINCFFISAGLCMLILLLPPLAVLMAITTPGPIFYTQERLGYHGTTFRMYKLRSMRAEKGCQNASSWTAQHDPRITFIGRLLRASHLDELPQIINILLGQMSLIGPRPEISAVADTLKEALPQHDKRLLIKPGLTGLAQVMHHYGDTIQDEEIKLMYDFYYIEHQSFRLDMQILLRTVGEVVLRHGR